MLGRYIDALPEEARDRILTAQDWVVGMFVSDDDEARCLVGHVESWSPDSVGLGPAPQASALVLLRRNIERLGRPCGKGGTVRPVLVTGRFDRLARRIGLERAVRLVKARAARGGGRSQPASVIAETQVEAPAEGVEA